MSSRRTPSAMHFTQPLIIIGLLCSPSQAGAPAFDVSEPTRSAVLEGMWNSLSELHTGSGTARWIMSGPGQREEREYSFTFDFDTGRSRVERSLERAKAGVCRIDSPEETIFYNPDAMLIERVGPQSDARVEGCEPFDARIISLLSLYDFIYESTFISSRDIINKMPEPRVNVREDGRYTITWESVKKTDASGKPLDHYTLDRQVVVVDALKRFLPERSEVWVGTGTSREIVGELYATTETKWDLALDAPVPSECSFKVYRGPVNGELRLAWKAVNEPINGREFTIDGLTAAAGTVVTNLRLGATIIESQIGGPPSRPIPRTETGARWRWILTITSIVFIMVMGIAVLLRNVCSRPFGH